MKPLAIHLFASILMVRTVATAEELQPPSEPDRTLTFRPHATLSQRQLVIKENESITTRKIGAFCLGKDARTRVQTLRGLQSSQGRIELADDTALAGRRLNFDSYLDVGLRWSRGATGNTVYYYWLFDPATGRLVRNEPLSKLMNVEVDKKRRVLRSHEAHRFGYEEYRWKKGNSSGRNTSPSKRV